MNFCTVNDISTSPKKVWAQLAQDGEMVITDNGKPTAIMLHIRDGEFDELSRAIRQAKAMRALNSIRAEAAERGFLSDEEIEAEILAYREERERSDSSPDSK